MDLSRFSKKRICVAVSGGVDSMTLLHFLLREKKKWNYQLSAVHCEHGIRGNDSLADEAFVRRICGKWDIPLVCFSENCIEKAQREKCSLETAARNFRYDCFSSLIDAEKADYIATAHHKNDEAETVLFRLARGTSLSGVKGIEAVRDWLIRPLLDWTRADIEAYAKENGFEYCVDSTNLQTDATRNKLRLEVLPKLEEAVNGAVSNLAHFALLAAEDDALLYEYSQTLLSPLEDKVGYCVLFCDKKPLFTRACLTALKGLGVEKDYTAKHLEALYALQNSERGAFLCLPQNIIAKRREKDVAFNIKEQEIITKKNPPKKFDKNGFDGGMYEVNVSKTPFTETDGAWKILKIDEEKIPQNAVFRFREDGDKITVFGGGTKTLKKFFNEKKTPVEAREYLPLIAEENGEEVYVVCGVEISEKVKITETTKQTLYIKIQKKIGEKL
jgi:tRNA(Ile)-lysidine synthase